MTTTLDGENEAELRALLAKATPGPWAIERQELDADFSDEDQEQAFPERVGPLWLAPGMSGDEPPQIEADVALVVAAVNALPSLLASDAAELYDSRAAWSERTFGPGDKYAGVVEHIRRELAEIERNPADLEEWVDVVMLAMDGAFRSAKADGAAFWAAFRAKAAKNEARQWAPPDAAGVVEHVRATVCPECGGPHPAAECEAD